MHFTQDSDICYAGGRKQTAGLRFLERPVFALTTQAIVCWTNQMWQVEDVCISQPDGQLDETAAVNDPLLLG